MARPTRWSSSSACKKCDPSSGGPAVSLLEITDLSTWMGLQVVSAEPRWKAALYFGLSQINEFTKNPDKFIPQPALEMPPGAPIGMPDDEFNF